MRLISWVPARGRRASMLLAILAFGIALDAQGQMQRRRILVPPPAPSDSVPSPAPAANSSAPETSSAPAASSATSAAASIAQKCGDATTQPPIIKSVQSLGKPWLENVITPENFTPDEPEAFLYAFIVKGCSLKSFDVTHREIIGFDRGVGITLSDLGQSTEIFHNNETAVVVPEPLAQSALGNLRSNIGPFAIVVQTPNGRAETEKIYYLAPPPRANSTARVAPAVDLTCVQDARPRLVRINGRTGAVQFTNAGNWRLSGCAFGSAAGSVELSARAGSTIATKIVSWSDTEIEIATQDFSKTTANQSSVAVSIVRPGQATLTGQFVHSYRVISPMPEGWSSH